MHDIEDELVFSNLDGFIFHDSRGIESGSTEELEILQEFIRQKSGKRRLEDRLHAIWLLSHVLMIATADHILKVLHFNGQPPTRVRNENL